MGWKHPGRTGAALYAVLAVVLGGLVTAVARLRTAHHRGRRRAAAALPAGPIIVVCNHAGYADGVVLALICRRMGRSLRLLATSGVFSAPGLGPVVRRLGFIPVERGQASAGDALITAAAALDVGEAVGIFPEGRTTRDPQQWPERAKTGAVRLALRTGAPIVPVAMVGTHRVLTRKSPVRSILTNLVLRPRVLTAVGEPIDIGSLTDQVDPDPDEVRRLSDEMMRRLVDLVEELRQEVAPDPIGVEPGSRPAPASSPRRRLRGGWPARRGG